MKKVHYKWNLIQIKHPLKEGALGGLCFSDICSGVNGKWYRNLWKEFNEIKTID